MKKGISESKVKRMRNLLTKKYNDKTKIRSGYTKKETIYKEGDMWNENGKQWTIKNGIKRTINKLSSARKILKTPLCCPKCNNSLNHPAHKAMYRRWGMCLICTTKWEHEMRENGTYAEWYKQFDEKNFNAFLQDVTVEYKEWLEGRDSKHFITEAGDIEDWSGGQDSKELEKEFNDKVKLVLEKRNAKANE